MRKKILIVDDEKDIVQIIKFNLEKAGYEVDKAYSGGSALDKIDSEKFDLILLDIMLPGIDGYEICRKLKSSEETRHIPVIMLTVKSDERDILKGLQQGADDYLTKPFSIPILIEKIKNFLLKQENKFSSDKINYKGLELDLQKFTMSIDSGPGIDLSATEFNILKLLIENPGRIFDRAEIISNAWKDSKGSSERAVDVHISGLRKKLGEKAWLLETVRGLGYRFSEND